ncbi:MAG: hypothetical protein QM642_01890 [Edaphocola sp.]
MKKKVNVTVGVFLPVPVTELMLSAVTAYYGCGKEELFGSKGYQEAARRRAILYHLSKVECNLGDTDIANLYGISRQSVQQALSRLEFETSKAVCLQSTCDVAAIRKIFADLRLKQDQWLNQISP